MDKLFELAYEPWAWIVLGGILLLFGGKLDLTALLEKLKSLIPIPSLSKSEPTLESAVKHYMALKDFCCECPEAMEKLDELWKCLPHSKGGH